MERWDGELIYSGSRISKNVSSLHHWWISVSVVNRPQIREVAGHQTHSEHPFHRHRNVGIYSARQSERLRGKGFGAGSSLTNNGFDVLISRARRASFLALDTLFP